MEVAIIIACAIITAQMNDRLRKKSFAQMESNVTENIKSWFKTRTQTFRRKQ